MKITAGAKRRMKEEKKRITGISVSIAVKIGAVIFCILGVKNIIDEQSGDYVPGSTGELIGDTIEIGIKLIPVVVIVAMIIVGILLARIVVEEWLKDRGKEDCDREVGCLKEDKKDKNLKKIMLKVSACVLAVSLLFSIVQKSEKEEKKEKVVDKSVEMFMSIKPGMDSSEVNDIFEKAEKEGLGKRELSYDEMEEEGDKGEWQFNFNKKDGEAEINETNGVMEKTSENGVSMAMTEQMGCDESHGADIVVFFEMKYVDGYVKPKMTGVMYRHDSDNDEMGYIKYSFNSDKVVDEAGIDESYRSILNKMREKSSKEEVDKLLVELTDGVVDEKEKKERIKAAEKEEKEIWEREMGL